MVRNILIQQYGSFEISVCYTVPKNTEHEKFHTCLIVIYSVILRVLLFLYLVQTGTVSLVMHVVTWRLRDQTLALHLGKQSKTYDLIVHCEIFLDQTSGGAEGQAAG